MHWKAFRNLLFFYGVWLSACFVIPAALLLLYFRIIWPAALVVAYYSYRFIFPARQWDWMRKALNADDTPYCRTAQIILEEGAKVPEPHAKVMTTVSPHGILTLGWSFIISSMLYFNTKTKWLVAPAMMQLPFIGDIMRWTCCQSCDAKTMSSIMATGCNVGLIPGGFQEATLYTRGKNRLFLNDRKGFIKFALKYGYHIQPTYVFGEELTFWTLDLLPTSVAFWLNKFHIPTCIFIGRYLFFMPDDDIDFTVVVGKNIELPHIENPTKEDVNKYHALFIERITALFNKHKGKYAATGESAVLEIV